MKQIQGKQILLNKVEVTMIPKSITTTYKVLHFYWITKKKKCACRNCGPGSGPGNFLYSLPWERPLLSFMQFLFYVLADEWDAGQSYFGVT